MARMSSSRMTRWSMLSSLTSVPAYLLKRTSSPGFTDMAMRAPASSTLPGPTATTCPLEGFSFAVSGIYNPPAVFSSDSRRFTSTRSFSGFSFMVVPPIKFWQSWPGGQDSSAPEACSITSGKQENNTLLRLEKGFMKNFFIFNSGVAVTAHTAIESCGQMA